jgi:hypothetical protein
LYPVPFDGLGLGGAILLPVAGVADTPLPSAIAADCAIFRIDRELLFPVLGTALVLTGPFGTHGLLGMKSGWLEQFLAETAAALIHPFKVTGLCSRDGGRQNPADAPPP